MQMAGLIEDAKQKQKSSNSIFLDKLKSIIHEELKKETIIFTATNQNSKFHYYTILDPFKIPLIQLYWVVNFSQNFISIKIMYSTYRTLGIPIIINDLRTKIEVNYALKLINKNVPSFLTYVLDENNQIYINFSRSYFNETDRIFLLKSIKSIVAQAIISARQQFQSLIPYLTIPVQTFLKCSRIEKDTERNDEFNLIKLKNTFDKFRKNRQKTTGFVFEEKDVVKTRKKIQQCTKIFGVELRSLENLKYTTKQIQTSKLLELIDQKVDKPHTEKVDRIAYQFQIISVKQSQKRYEVNANSQIYFGKYSFRIFKTLFQEERITKSHDSRKSDPIFEQKDVIEERVARLVKKKAMDRLSQKALRNETGFLKLLRNQFCLYIATYYLPLEKSWNELYIEQYDSTLLSLINEKDPKPFSVRIDIMKKVLLGLKFIADSSICHRDIKPSNIMINKSNDPKIIDFGSTISVYNQKVLMSYNEQLCGTEGYYVPYEDCDEQIKKIFTKKEYECHPLFDIYSCGIIAEKLFEDELSQKSKNNSIIKDTMHYIVQRCKQHNPDNRLSYDEVLCLLMGVQRVLFQKQQNQPAVVF